jgi:dihydropteroate synthase
VRALARLGPVSIDTRRAAVARAALEAGAVLVNDVSGAADPEMLPLVARADVDVVLMHMRGEPATMQSLTDYGDVCAEVWAALDALVARAMLGGVRAERIIVDPGIGFAKTFVQNLALLRDLPRRTAGRRVLIGASRKAFIGAITGQTRADERLEGSLAVALHAAAAGAAYVRVHDVIATRRALAVQGAIAAGAPP